MRAESVAALAQPLTAQDIAKSTAMKVGSSTSRVRADMNEGMEVSGTSFAHEC